jgi:hypothetical protein
MGGVGSWDVAGLGEDGGAVLVGSDEGGPVLGAEADRHRAGDERDRARRSGRTTITEAAEVIRQRIKLGPEGTGGGRGGVFGEHFGHDVGGEGACGAADDTTEEAGAGGEREERHHHPLLAHRRRGEVCSATEANTSAQLLRDAPIPDSNTTVGDPEPRLTKCSERPSRVDAKAPDPKAVTTADRCPQHPKPAG